MAYARDPKRDLVLERDVDVPVDFVWRAWTTPELIKQWFAPAPWKTPECTIDLRPGGLFRTLMRSPEGHEMDNVGCCLEVVPNAKLVITSSLGPEYRPQATPAPGADLPFQFTAIIAMKKNANGGTTYTATVIHGDSETRGKHEAMGFRDGWSAALAQLVALAPKK